MIQDGKIVEEMKKNLKSVFLNIFIIGMLSSCSIDNELKNVRIIYGPEYATVIVPISCSSIEYDLLGIERRIISENVFLQRVEIELKKLRIDSEYNLSTKSVDIRIKCFLDYVAKTDTLCLGEFSGVIFNGELMKDSHTLLTLFKSNIYVNQE